MPLAKSTPAPTPTEPPGRYTIQQLKSIADDLGNTFRKLDGDMRQARDTQHLVGTSATKQRIRRMSDKCNRIASQIAAINITISYLETHIK